MVRLLQRWHSAWLGALPKRGRALGSLATCSAWHSYRRNGVCVRSNSARPALRSYCPSVNAPYQEAPTTGCSLLVNGTLYDNVQVRWGRLPAQLAWDGGAGALEAVRRTWSPASMDFTIMNEHSLAPTAALPPLTGALWLACFAAGVAQPHCSGPSPR